MRPFVLGLYAGVMTDVWDFQSAIKIYQEMIGKKEFAEQKAEMLYSVADAYIQLENKTEAAKSFEKMRALRPKNGVYRLTALAKLLQGGCK